MNDTMRITFHTKEARDYFFDHANRNHLQYVYFSWPDSARKDVKRIGNPTGNRRILIDRRGVMNPERLRNAVQSFGGRIEN